MTTHLALPRSHLMLTNSPIFQNHRTLIIKLVLLVCLVLSFFVISNAASAQYTDIKRLGTSQAICEAPGIQTADELQTFFDENADTVRQILNDANWQGDSAALFAAVENGDFTERNFPVGTTFEWMGMRKNAQVTASPKRRWAGTQSFTGYQVDVVTACETHQIVIPKICCNVALTNITEITTQPTLQVTSNNASLRVCTDTTSQTQVTLTSPDGINNTLNLDNSGCWFEDKLPAGEYTIKATDSCGETIKTATINQMAAPLDQGETLTARQFTPFIAAFIGSETLMRFETSWSMEMRDSSGIAGIRGGLKIPLTQSLAFVPSIGALNRNGINNGNVYPDNTIFTDFGLEANITKNFFLGAGIGLWDANKSDFREESIFINAGGKVTSNSEWFIEARGIDSDNPDGKDGFSDNRTFNAGIRLLFN